MAPLFFLIREMCTVYYEENRQIVNRQQRKLYAMYAIGNTISIVKKYQININLKVESVYKIPKALEIDLFSFIFIREMCTVYYEENEGRLSGQ